MNSQGDIHTFSHSRGGAVFKAANIQNADYQKRTNVRTFGSAAMQGRDDRFQGITNYVAKGDVIPWLSENYAMHRLGIKKDPSIVLLTENTSFRNHAWSCCPYQDQLERTGNNLKKQYGFLE